MDADAVDAHDVVVPPSPVHAAETKNAAAAQQRAEDRFYCPYPGCNRSFAELWRLKVHYRAPPDIRGSGKERGHGTELTHCPKCGKTLKPGKHHVGCSGGKTAPRQANKRSRAADGDPADEGMLGSPHIKHVRGGEFDYGLQPPSWQDFSGTYPIAPAGSLALPPGVLKQERQEWAPGAQPGMMYSHPAAPPGTCWVDAGQMNGFVPQVQPQVFQQAQFAQVAQADLQFGPGGPHAAFAAHAQMPPFSSSFSGFSQAIPGMAQPGQVVTLQGMNGMPMQTVLLHPQQLQQQQPQQPQPHPPGAAVTAVGQQGQGQGQGQGHEVPPQLPAGSGPLDEAVVPSMGHGADRQQPGEDGQQQQQQQHMHAATGNGPVSMLHDGGGGGGGTGPARMGSGGAPAAPTSSDHDSQGLGSMFEDVEEFQRDFGRIPSPPPLPADFHAASGSGSGAGMLFNFHQFNQKLPRSQSVTKLDQNLAAHGLDPGLDSDALYDHSDDGDLMQLLFGVPDELPSMATIHLHNWGNQGEEGEGGPGRGGAGGAGQEQRGGREGRPPAPVVPSTGPHGHGHGQGGHEVHRPAAAGAMERAEVGGMREQEQNGKAGLEGLGHSGGGGVLLPARGSSVEAVHGGGGGGKQLHHPALNGISHAPDEHPRDHLLDAETFRLLQSCD